MKPADEETVLSAIRGERPYLRPIERREAVLRLASQGMENKKVAGLLGIEDATVRRIKRWAPPGAVIPTKKPKRVKEPDAPKSVERVAPSLCGCGCKRIDHSGGGRCASCPCKGFEVSKALAPASASIPVADRRLRISPRTMELRQRRSVAVRLVAGGTSHAEAARQTGINIRTLDRALHAQRLTGRSAA